MKRTAYDGVLTKSDAPLDFKADSEQGLIEGYASKFWVVDSYGEVTAPGAFQKSISERGPAGAGRIPVRYEHQHTIGTHTDMSEDADGLVIEGKISDDGQYGTAVRSHLKDGVKYGLSIGFRAIGWRNATEDDPLDFSTAPSYIQKFPPEDIIVLTEIRLMENSVVTFPAVDSATVDSYRNAAAVTGWRDMSALIAAVKAGAFTTEQLEELRSAIEGAPNADRLSLADVTRAANHDRFRFDAYDILMARFIAQGVQI
jgi:HK97 family phage prohead protease